MAIAATARRAPPPMPPPLPPPPTPTPPPPALMPTITEEEVAQLRGAKAAAELRARDTELALTKERERREMAERTAQQLVSDAYEQQAAPPSLPPGQKGGKKGAKGGKKGEPQGGWGDKRQ
eukprot:gene11495-63790_t